MELIERMRRHADKPALIYKNKAFSNGDLLDLVHTTWHRFQLEHDIQRGSCVTLVSAWSPEAIAAFLALAEQRCIIALADKNYGDATAHLAGAWASIRVEDGCYQTVRRCANGPEPLQVAGLKSQGQSGLVLFTSGTTGLPKAAIRNLDTFLSRYTFTRQAHRRCTTLNFDHMGGIDVLLRSLFSGGCLVIPREISLDTVFSVSSRNHVEILTCTPTFLKLMLLGKVWEKYDISTLRTITYGAEPVHEHVLTELSRHLPHTQLIQTYGSTELGVLRTKAHASRHAWLRFDKNDFRIEDGTLEVRWPPDFLGYLGPNEIKQGWFKTGDAAETNGDLLRIVGRRSSIINVGGNKFFPLEIENSLLGLPGIKGAKVFAEPNALTGSHVAAQVHLSTSETMAEFRKRMVAQLKAHLPTFKIPHRLELVQESLVLNGDKRNLKSSTQNERVEFPSGFDTQAPAVQDKS